MLIIGWWLVMLVGGALSVEVEETSGGSRVEILRCCSEGEDLKKLGIAEGEFVCNGSPDPFKPLVYSPRTSSFLDELPESWRVRLNARPNCTAGQQLRYVPLGKFQPMIIFDSGSIELEVGSAVFIQPHEYCLGASSILACIPRSEGLQAAATMRPKLRKCCGPNAAYDSSQACSTWRSVDNVPAMTLEEDKALLLSTKNSSGGAIFAGLEIVEGWPVCSPSEDVTIVGSMADAALQADASLLLKGQHIPAEEFCIERLRHEARQLLPAKVFTCFKHRDKGNSKEEKNKNDIRFVLYPLGFIVGAIFLAATLATGCLLPASHHVLHWRCQTRHVLCLLIGDISMAAIQLAGSSSLKEKEMCRVLAILAHFFFLATFFWLNTMCFNIWWTFRDLRPASLEKGQEMIRLRFYEAYAWGGPLIIAGLAAFLDHLPHAEGDTLLRPHFGENSCWFSPNGKTEIFAYFFGPIGVLLAINLIFFAATARELTCGLWKGEFVKSTTERAALGKVCLKLVVVMGVPWIFDVISWLVGGPNFLWYVTDVLNAAQGVLIFIVVGCQPQVRAALKRLWSRNPRANANRQGNGLSTTSHGMPSMGDSVTQNPSTKTAPLETIC